jgi:hypothetical protein
MSNRAITRMSRRALLGAGLFVGTSLLLKGCNTPSATTLATPGSSTRKGQLVVTT